MSDLLERQHQLETLASEMGVSRYEKSRPMPWRETVAGQKEEADLKPGRELVRRSIEPFVTAIEEMLESAKSGRASRGRPSVALKYLQQFEPETVAFIAARCIINAAAGRDGLTKAAMSTAVRLNDHYTYAEFEKKDPGLFRLTLRKLEKSSNEGYRRGVLSYALKLTSVKGLEWRKEEMLQVGVKLVSLFVESTGLVVVKTERFGKKTQDKLEFAPESAEWLASMHEKCALLAPVHLPMVVPPVRWSTPLDGGYLDHRMLRLELVKTGRKETLDELFSADMPAVYAAVNAVQETPWRINRFVADVVREAWARGMETAGLPSSEDEPLPARPSDIPEGIKAKDLPEEQRLRIRKWAVAAAQTHARNAERVGKRFNLRQQMWIADTFRDDAALYFPHTLDFRGRMYPVPALVNPQGDDLGRGLLEFANGKPLGETGGYWLAVHLANTFGFDKAPFDERVQWVKDNEEMILDAAARPLTGGMEWTQADKPWQFLAACAEWAGFLLAGDEYVSHLPIQMDGSCSGLQHLSAMLRDEVGGAAVNLIPSATKRDIYGIVAERTVALVMADGDPMGLAAHIDRKLVKQPTMTYAYSATERGMRDQIVSAIRSNLGDLRPDPFKDANYLAGRVRQAIEETVKAAAGAMRFLQDSVKVASKNNLPIRWTTPLGLPVLQDARLLRGKLVKAIFAGQRKRLLLNVETSKIDARAQKSGVAPNFVHSLDATHLMMTVNDAVEAGLRDFSMVHDSFGTHAADVDVLHVVIRRAFVNLYASDRLGEFRAELETQLPPELAADLPHPPAPGSLDLSAVHESDFFFA